MQNLSNNPDTTSRSKEPLTQLLTEDDLAERWRVSVKTLRNDRVSGTQRRIPFVKIGRCVRYRLSDIEAYEDSHTIGSTSEGRL